MNPLDFLRRNGAELGRLTLEHIMLVVLATVAAALIAVPVGVLLSRRPSAAKPVLAIANVLQTVPSLALFGFLIPLLGRYGIGRVPAVVALFVYALLPILRNTLTGIRGVDRTLRDAGLGIGMTDWQLLTLVELPLASPVILAGVRVATVISVGTATVAAAIGAGGLGTYIFRGLRTNDNALLIAGALPAALLALGADALLGVVERRLATGKTKVTPKTIGGVGAAAFAALGLGMLIALGVGSKRDNTIVIASKDFTEQVIVGELIAQVIEANTSLSVERRWELAGDLCHRAMIAGEVDAYVEYTGTAYIDVLKQRRNGDQAAVFDRVKREYESRYGESWMSPLGFDNTFAVLVRGADARRLNLRTISDAVPYAREWRAGFGQDFMSREDGYAGFVGAYGLAFHGAPHEMDLAFTYRALATGQVDLIAGNATDALIDALDLYQLKDDRHYFPPYQAAPVVRDAVLSRHPELYDLLGALAGHVTDGDMRRMNGEVDTGHRDARDVVHAFLSSLGPLH